MQVLMCLFYDLAVSYGTRGAGAGVVRILPDLVKQTSPPCGFQNEPVALHKFAHWSLIRGLPDISTLSLGLKQLPLGSG